MCFVRLTDKAALWVEVDGVNLASEGLLRFGGEGRVAHYKILNPPLPPLQSSDEIRQAIQSKKFKVVLMSPAWFSGGWKPQDGDWHYIFNAPVRLIAIALPRPQLLGGFDIAQGKPKPLRSFVPAGTVYFFEADTPFELPHDFAFAETPDSVCGDWTRIGLGKVLIGRW